MMLRKKYPLKTGEILIWCIHIFVKFHRGHIHLPSQHHPGPRGHQFCCSTGRYLKSHLLSHCLHQGKGIANLHLVEFPKVPFIGGIRWYIITNNTYHPSHDLLGEPETAIDLELQSSVGHFQLLPSVILLFSAFYGGHEVTFFRPERKGHVFYKSTPHGSRREESGSWRFFFLWAKSNWIYLW